MKRLKASGLILGAVIGLTVFNVGLSDAAKPESRITVEVVDSGSRTRVAGARVFVMSDEGKELASALTDKSGFASLPALAAEAKPKYVLVHHPNFFISGLNWIPGRTEYYILVQLLAVK